MEIPQASQKKYLIRRHEDLARAKQALLDSDFAVIQSIGHQWKGNGATFGFPELGALGSNLEEAAAEKRIHDVKSLVAEFEIWIKSHPIE
jgi:HPt (histidine-containing phosphotransfer) domain-containing protein